MTSSLTQTPTRNPNPNLSTGAKAAIGVVVPLFILAVVGLAVFFIWKRRKGASQTQPTTSGAETMGEYHKAELPVEGNTKEPVRVELSGSGVETGYTSANVHELAND
jgi:predicted membrane-bound mannosyltransferase